MPLTEARRRANNKYNLKHYTTLACKVRREYAEIFRAVCLEMGTTPNAVLKKAADDFLKKNNINAALDDMEGGEADG